MERQTCSCRAIHNQAVLIVNELTDAYDDLSDTYKDVCNVASSNPDVDMVQQVCELRAIIDCLKMVRRDVWDLLSMLETNLQPDVSDGMAISTAPEDTDHQIDQLYASEATDSLDQMD